jgi:two-component system chemotaxis response regulator CheY
MSVTIVRGGIARRNRAANRPAASQVAIGRGLSLRLRGRARTRRTAISTRRCARRRGERFAELVSVPPLGPAASRVAARSAAVRCQTTPPAVDADAKERAMQALIVDDSSTMRGILSRNLRGMNIEAIEAANGKLALDALDSRGARPAPDFILLDWHMPEMDGYEFLCELRKRPSLAALPVVMVTSEPGAESIEQARAAGAVDFLFKPFTREALRGKLEGLGLQPATAG